MISAWGSTALICSPSRAKSAARMEAATRRPRIRRILAPGPLLALVTSTEPRHEHRVGAVAVWPQAGPFDRPAVGAREGIGPEEGGLRQECIAGGIGLGPRVRAYRI